MRRGDVSCPSGRPRRADPARFRPRRLQPALHPFHPAERGSDPGEAWPRGRDRGCRRRPERDGDLHPMGMDRRARRVCASTARLRVQYPPLEARSAAAAARVGNRRRRLHAGPRGRRPPHRRQRVLRDHGMQRRRRAARHRGPARRRRRWAGLVRRGVRRPARQGGPERPRRIFRLLPQSAAGGRLEVANVVPGPRRRLRVSQRRRREPAGGDARAIESGGVGAGSRGRDDPPVRRPAARAFARVRRSELVPTSASTARACGVARPDRGWR